MVDRHFSAASETTNPSLFFFLYVVYCSLFCWHNAKPAWLWTFSENQTELRARCRYNEGWGGSGAGPGGAVLEHCRFLPFQLLWGKQQQRRVQGGPGSPGRPRAGAVGVRGLASCVTLDSDRHLLRPLFHVN